MRFCALSLIVAFTSVSAFQLHSSTQGATRHVAVSMAKDMESPRTTTRNHEWGIWGRAPTPLLTVVAGWALASQVAVASLVPDAVSFTPDAMIPKDSTSLLTSATVETLDFSLPSYDASTPKKEAPSFNPFADFKPEIISGGDNLKAADEERAAVEAAKAEEKAAQKAAADARKEEDRAARDARKADEKAAAEAAKAERAAEDAARKAEKEAKRQEELEKQRAAVDRQSESPAAAASADDVKLPSFDMSDFKAPDIKIPEFKAPDVKLPDFKAPDLSSFKAPEMPKFDMPDLPNAAGGDATTFKAPEMPKFAMPKVDMPKFDMPKVDMPALPSGAVDGAAPKVSLPAMPAFSNPFGGSAVEDENMAPQEVRDEAAREARNVYLAADADAKEAEEAARKVRDAANEKAKLASVAKDIACETRPGGKLLCLRNPFTSGY